MKTNTHDRSGLSFLEVLFVVVTVALVGFTLLPRMARARCHGCCRISCTSNLKQIGLAFRLYSNDHDDRFPFAVSNDSDGTLGFVNSSQVIRHFESLSNELITPRILVCPSDAGRLRGFNFLTPLANSNLSYFVGLDADEAKPERLLSGDRNITGGKLSNGFLRLLRTNSPAGFTAAIHTNAGNIGLADASVRQMTPRTLQRQLQSNTLAVIRLAIP